MILLALLLLIAPLTAGSAPPPLRVSTWDLRLPAAPAVQPALVESRIHEAAAALGPTNPDVILLQEAGNWQICSRLVQALRPADYNILVCSAFPASAVGDSSAGQVAILGKKKAYFSWSEPWHDDGKNHASGGFAFAAIRAGDRKIGLFSVVLGGSFPRTKLLTSALAQQWRADLDSFRNWEANRIEVAAVGGIGVPLQSQTSDAEYLDAFLGAPLENPIVNKTVLGTKTNDVFTAHLAPDAQGLPAVLLDRPGLICDLHVGQPKPATLVPTVPIASSASTSSDAGDKAQPMTNGSAFASQERWPATKLWLAGICVVGVGMSWVGLRLGRRRQGSRLRPATDSGASQALAPSATVVITARVAKLSVEDRNTSGSPVVQIEGPLGTRTQSGSWRLTTAGKERAERAQALREGWWALWSQWLKEKLVRRLIAERAALLETQHTATLKALEVERRLSRVEVEVERQTQVYERRIEELTRELQAAKADQRELIQAQISRVKADMEAARARVRAEEG